MQANHNFQEHTKLEYNKIKENIKDNFLKSILTRKGLENYNGVNCWMDSVLQCFANNLDLAATILAYNYCTNNNWNEWDYYNNTKIYVKLNDHTTPLTKAFATVLENLYNHNCNIKYFKPDQFRNVLGNLSVLFKEKKPNDSKDLVQFMLETLHSELNKAKNSNKVLNKYYTDNPVFNAFANEYFSKNQSVISDNFYFSRSNIMECQHCHAKTYNFQIYNFLTFPLEEVRLFKLNNNDNTKVTLYDCFNYDRKIEFFTGANAIYCNSCKNDKCPATNTDTLYICPNTLSIILNRGKGNQFNVPIVIPEILDLKNYVEQKKSPSKYYLSGLVGFSGESGPNGHFFAFTRNSSNSPWVRYNDAFFDSDDNTQKLLKDTLAGETNLKPYILFYTQC